MQLLHHLSMKTSDKLATKCYSISLTNISLRNIYILLNIRIPGNPGKVQCYNERKAGDSHLSAFSSPWNKEFRQWLVSHGSARIQMLRWGMQRLPNDGCLFQTTGIPIISKVFFFQNGRYSSLSSGVYQCYSSAGELLPSMKQQREGPDQKGQL